MKVLSTLRVGFFLCMLMLGAFFAYAQENFTVQTMIGTDTTPPSIPGSLTATPVATSQINLAWATSTDDFQLSGYHVWRDNVQIATTTSTSYADVGLSASTTYAYYITAFDTAFNESASSSIVSTTTLSSSTPPMVETPEDTGGGTQFGSKGKSFEGMITSLQIFEQRDGAVIRFTTNEYIRAVIRWGLTDAYEIGSLSERSYVKEHETTIVGLDSETRYFFRIEGENSSGKRGILHTGSFKTLPPQDTFPPGNVTNLRGTQENTDIVLFWQNPPDLDFEKVRIVANNKFYPSDIADGWVVYEGSLETFRDRGALVDTKNRYYTVFTYDALGNISSGAVIAFSPDGVLQPPQGTENTLDLSFEDIEFIQDNHGLSKDKNTVLIDGSKQLRIRILYEHFPEHLKTILVTLRHPIDSEKTFSFLLRINSDKSAYESTLAPLGVTGIFPFRLAIFDYTTAQIGYTEGSLISHIGFAKDSEFGVFVLPPHDIFIKRIIIAFCILFAFFLILRFASRTFTLARK